MLNDYKKPNYSMKHHSKYTKIEAVKRAELGEPIEAICEELNICRSTFYNWRKSILSRSRANDETVRVIILKKEISKLKSQNTVLSEIIDLLNVDHNTLILLAARTHSGKNLKKEEILDILSINRAQHSATV